MASALAASAAGAHNMVVVVVLNMIGAIIFIFGWYFYQSIYKRIGQASQAIHHACNQETDNDLTNSLEDDTLLRCFNESSNNDPILKPIHKIFVSHSGAQKEFVEHLCKALEDRWHYPFFDRRHESLPKGERFPELIIQAAKQCEMLIVVVSNEYFMSKWPMIELNTFVKAHGLNNGAKCIDGGPKILPLFYGLSISDLEVDSISKKWFQKWKALAKVDSKNQIVVNDWKYALDVLKSFNGIEYNKQMKEIVAYEDEIVAHVCQSIVPNMKWDDSHVQGKSSICKVILTKVEEIGVSNKYQIKVVGIHGVSGIGKTTTCKTLSNELLKKYKGRVCHLEFQSVLPRDSIVLLQKVLRDLTKKSTTMIQLLNEGECKYALRTSLSKQRVLLAIDNVSDDYESIKHAKMFLELLYHKESLVIVTARSKSILERLGIDENACLEMPELEEVDAMKLFLHHATHGKQFIKDENKSHILKCIQRCYFSKGVGLGHHYHPLALEALGLQLYYHGGTPLEWVKNLPRVRTFGYLSRTNPVFDILRSNFNLLPSSEQSLFIDVGLFDHLRRQLFHTSSIQWLCDVYNEDEDAIKHRLEHLKRKGLLQDVDWRSRQISIHDLYFEFAKFEAQGSFNESTNLTKRKWVYVDDGNLTKLEGTPQGRCWPKLIRLAIAQQKSTTQEKHCQIVDKMERLKGIQWDYFSNVEILHLRELHWGQGSLNLEHLMGLRYLDLYDISGLNSLEGLEKLKNLTCFSWISFQQYSSEGTITTHFLGQLPLSLKTLHIEDRHVVLGLDLLAQCYNLLKIVVRCVEASVLDLSNCESLESVSLWEIQKLHTLLGLNTYQPSKLQSLVIYDCEDLVDILDINHLIDLMRLRIANCEKLEVPSLLALTKLQVLELESGRGVQSLVVDAKGFIPCQLLELSCSYSQSMKGLNLSGFNHLEVLTLSFSDGLRSLEEVGDLPALQCLDLSYCKHLLQLPDLKKSTNLKALNLEGCFSLELREKDIQMLSKLLLLQPVPFSREDEPWKFRFDFIRRKVLIHSCKQRHCVPFSGLLWKEHKWEDRDLDAPPLQIGKRGTLEEGMMDSSLEGKN